MNEVRVMATLDPHPHVLSLLEGFLDGPHLCIVMQLAPNGDLGAMIR